MKLLSVPLERISTSRFQYRDAALGVEQLAESIASQGLIQPIVVCEAEDGEGYELVAGERRFLAVSILAAAGRRYPGSMAPWTIEAILRDGPSAAATLGENVVRVDASVLETVAAVHRYCSSGAPLERVAADLGISVRDVVACVSVHERLSPCWREAAGRSPVSSWSPEALAVVAAAPEADQDHAWWFCRWGLPVDPRPHTVSDLLRRALKLRPLASAPWDTGVDGIAGEGPCSSCSRTTKTLVDELSPNICMDVRCWRRKAEATVAAAVESGRVPVSSGDLGRLSGEDATIPAVVADGPRAGERVLVRTESPVRLPKRVVVDRRRREVLSELRGVPVPARDTLLEVVARIGCPTPKRTGVGAREAIWSALWTKLEALDADQLEGVLAIVRQ